METTETNDRPLGLRLLAVGLWIVTSVLSFLLITGVLDLITRIYAAFWGGSRFYGDAYWGIVTLRQLLSLPLALLSIGVIIGSGEYHVRHFNEPSSWALFARILAVEVALLMLTLML
jgi:hypothetical protein